MEKDLVTNSNAMSSDSGDAPFINGNSIEQIAQWVIDNRYLIPGGERMTDTEMYHLLIDKIKSLNKNEA